MSNKQKQSKKMKKNGQLDNIEIIPDLENEMIEEQVNTPPPPKAKKGGCGCQKNKMATAPAPATNWTRIALIVGGLALLYFLFIKKKGKAKMPDVEVGGEV